MFIIHKPIIPIRACRYHPAPSTEGRGNIFMKIFSPGEEREERAVDVNTGWWSGRTR